MDRITGLVAGNPLVFAVLGIAGLHFLGSRIVFFLALLYRHFLRPATNLKRYGAGQGAYAIVTGATDGIGKEYAKQLARKGFNLVLISRTQERLDATASEIKEGNNKVDVKVLAVDLSRLDDAAVNKIRSAIAGLDVTVLVNNAGVSFDVPTPFAELNITEIRQMIELNVRSVTELTHIVLPYMVEKRRGLIVNLSSGAGVYPNALLSVYSGTKAYVTFWSTALGLEYKKSGIHVECQTPFLVVSKLSKARASWMVPSAAAYVRAALRGIGTQLVTSPYWAHDLIHWLFQNIYTKRRVLSHLHERMAAGRRRHLARAQKGDSSQRAASPKRGDKKSH